MAEVILSVSITEVSKKKNVLDIYFCVPYASDCVITVLPSVTEPECAATESLVSVHELYLSSTNLPSQGLLAPAAEKNVDVVFPIEPLIMSVFILPTNPIV